MACPYRVTREGKERRKRWAQRRTSSKPDKKAPKEVEDEDTKQSEENEETNTMPGMLPTSVIEILAAREKYVHFLLYHFLLKPLFLTWTSLVTLSSSHTLRQTFASDSEEENVKQKVQKRKKRMKTDGYV